MTGLAVEYDPRYLAGILFFNRRDFFEAHEVWEDLWQECTGEERRFYQGLIQAAVALYHFGNRNVRGAAKLFKSSRAYMERYASPYLGLDRVAFWQQMEVCFKGLVETERPDAEARLDEGLIPTIELHPGPREWPDPDDFVQTEEA